MSGMVSPGRKVASAVDVREPGDWFIDQDAAEAAQGIATLCYRAPDGVLNSGGWRYDHIYIRTGEEQSGYWQWDGDLEKPTVSPSIRHRGASRWHGFLEGGDWRTV